MHIKLVVNSFPVASQTFLFNLVTGLEKRGVRVTVCVSKRSKDLDLYKHRLNEWSGDIELIPIQRNYLSKIAYLISFIFSCPLLLIKTLAEKGVKQEWNYFVNMLYLAKGKPDIIHFSFSTNGVYNLYCLDYLRRRSIRLVVSCNGTAEKIKPLVQPDLKEKLKALFSKVDLVHCISKDMRDSLVPFGIIDKKTFINYPAVELDKFAKATSRDSNNTKWSIVTTGRLCYQKGYAYALQALKKLADRNIQFTYHIVGEGPDREMISFMIRELALTDLVVMHGRVSSEKVIEILRSADVFLLSSLSEGVANAALEAMSMELPVVCTSAGGMSEVIKHGENGLLTDWRDLIHMAEQLLWLHENPAEAKEMGRKARVSVQNLFSLDRQIDIFISQYRRLLEVPEINSLVRVSRTNFKTRPSNL